MGTAATAQMNAANVAPNNNDGQNAGFAPAERGGPEGGHKIRDMFKNIMSKISSGFQAAKAFVLGRFSPVTDRQIPQAQTNPMRAERNFGRPNSAERVALDRLSIDSDATDASELMELTAKLQETGAYDTVNKQMDGLWANRAVIEQRDDQPAEEAGTPRFDVNVDGAHADPDRLAADAKRGTNPGVENANTDDANVAPTDEDAQNEAEFEALMAPNPNMRMRTPADDAILSRLHFAADKPLKE
ncbi:hypothetical protein [Yoonia sp. BS5-3]|uniref:Uncharacterized protein n=1 Tax=Yoonia phaeophyticola TaxID=3137369 RepID=A0ABZ2V0N6_9RHOB